MGDYGKPGVRSLSGEQTASPTGIDIQSVSGIDIRHEVSRSNIKGD